MEPQRPTLPSCVPPTEAMGDAFDPEKEHFSEFWHFSLL
jgi:hypothetical protein